jgi:hypothetical protein
MFQALGEHGSFDQSSYGFGGRVERHAGIMAVVWSIVPKRVLTMKRPEPSMNGCRRSGVGARAS